MTNTTSSKYRVFQSVGYSITVEGADEEEATAKALDVPLGQWTDHNDGGEEVIVDLLEETEDEMIFDIEEFRESLYTPTLSDSRKYRDAPVHILDSINAYVEHGQRPGGFLAAVLQNNLTGALRSADDASRRGLDDIILYIWNEVPATCWGSTAKVEAWLGEETPRTQEDLILSAASAETLQAYLDAAHDIGEANAEKRHHSEESK